MEQQVSELASHLLTKLDSLPAGERYLVAICGIPGSGKSSLALHVCDAVNKLSASASSRASHKARAEADATVAGEDKLANGAAERAGSHAAPDGDSQTSAEANDGPAIVVGMDGWHLSREQLDQMPDPREAHDRRGAAFTFDGEAFSQFVLSLRAPIPPTSSIADPSSEHIITGPTFSHASKDPVAGALRVRAAHRLVLLEGLYCCVAEPPWRAAAQAVDERWAVDVERAVARKRLVERHVLTGVARDEEEANWRADNNDMPNGDWLMDRLLQPVRMLPSLRDPSWAGSG